MKLTKEFAKYLLDREANERGWLINDKELDVSLDFIRKNQAQFTLLCGDTITYTKGHWLLKRAEK